jgi:hypothetical protein
MAMFAGERSLPNGRVDDTTLADWQAVLDLIAVERPGSVFRAHGTDRPIPETASELFSTDRLLGGVRVVLASGVQVNFLPVEETTIDFDIDSRQLVDQHHLDDLSAFIRDLGRRLDKPVLLAREGDDDAILLRYEPGADRFVTGS